MIANLSRRTSYLLSQLDSITTGPQLASDLNSGQRPGARLFVAADQQKDGSERFSIVRNAHFSLAGLVQSAEADPKTYEHSFAICAPKYSSTLDALFARCRWKSER